MIPTFSIHFRRCKPLGNKQEGPTILSLMPRGSLTAEGAPSALYPDNFAGVPFYISFIHHTISIFIGGLLVLIIPENPGRIFPHRNKSPWWPFTASPLGHFPGPLCWSPLTVSHLLHRLGGHGSTHVAAALGTPVPGGHRPCPNSP